MKYLRLLTQFFLLTIMATLPVWADTCNSFASYTCAKSTPNIVHLEGTGETGQSVGELLGSNTFSVSFRGNKSFVGDDLLLLAAAPNTLTGNVNGVSFASLSSFPDIYTKTSPTRRAMPLSLLECSNMRNELLALICAEALLISGHLTFTLADDLE